MVFHCCLPTLARTVQTGHLHADDMLLVRFKANITLSWGELEQPRVAFPRHLLRKPHKVDVGVGWDVGVLSSGCRGGESTRKMCMGTKVSEIRGMNL